MSLRFLAALAATLSIAVQAKAAGDLVYVGAARELIAYRFDAHAGRVKLIGPMASLASPSSLVVHSDRRFLYAASEQAGGTVSAFLIDPGSGKLSLLTQSPSKGVGPCDLSLDRSGRWLAVANCGSGSVAVFPLRKDGGLGNAQATVRPEGGDPHAHTVLFSPDNRFLLVADFGLDRILVYRFDAETGSLAPADPPYVATEAGVGVSRLAFHPGGRVLYALNEIRPGVTAYRYDPATGVLSEFQTLPTLPADHTGTTAAGAIAVNAAGTLVYASNRGLDRMGLLVVDPVRFTLSPLEFTPLLGQAPRDFSLAGSGYLIVANQDSNSLTVYTVHPRTGQLRPVGRTDSSIEKPACLVFVPGQ